MRTTIVAWTLAVALLGAVPLAGAAEPEDPIEEREEWLEECQDEFHWPPPSEKNTICGKLAQAYWDLTPWEATADTEVCAGDYVVHDVEACVGVAIDEGYAEECLQEFTFPAPEHPETVCGQIAKIYGDATEPSSLDREVCVDLPDTPATCVPVSTCLGDYTDADVEACIV